MRAMKDSGFAWIGDIPSDWETGRIGGLYTHRNEKVSDFDYAPLSVTMQGIVPQLETAAKTDDHNNRKLVKAGDFAINSRSDRRGSCGISPLDGSVSLINTVLKPHEAMCPGYYNYLFHTSEFADEFYRMGYGIVDDLWTTRWADMKTIRVPLPSLEEQQRIADYLDKRCAAIDAQKAVLEKEVDALQRLRKSTIHKAVTQGLDESVSMKETGVDWLIQIPSHWHLEKLNHFASAELGLMIDKKREMTNNVHKYLSCRDVSWFSINSAGLAYTSFPSGSEARYGIKDGDIMVCEGGEVGRSCVWRGQAPDFYYQKSVHRLRVNPSVAYPEYIAYQMFQKAKVSEFREIRKGEATIGHLPGDQLSQLRFVLPPLNEQRRIAAYLDERCAAIDSVIDTRAKQISRLEDYRKALIFQYVTGKKEVPV